MKESFPKEIKQHSSVNRVQPLRLFGQITVYRLRKNIHLQFPQVIKVVCQEVRRVWCKISAMGRRGVLSQFKDLNFYNRLVQKIQSYLFVLNVTAKFQVFLPVHSVIL